MSQRPRGIKGPSQVVDTRALANSDDLALLGRLVWLYYVEHLTQAEIATRLGISRFRVLRGLKRSTDLALVRVSIDLDGLPVAVDLEHALIRRFNLAGCVVVRGSDPTSRASLAAAAASYLETVIRDRSIVGVGISSTVAEIPRFLRRRATSSGTTVIGLSGGAQESTIDRLTNPSDVSAQIAMAINARVVNLLAPFVFASAEACRAVISEAQVAEPLRLARQADVAIVGIGHVGPSAWLVTQGCITGAEISELQSLGAVGDVLGRFYTIDGEVVDGSLAGRVIGLGLEELREIPLVVAVAAGEHKTDAILGALYGGCVNSLVTDAVTAAQILERSTELRFAPRRTHSRMSCGDRQAVELTQS